MIDIISWNVNGIRACEKKGLFSFLRTESPDFFCIQETKAQKGQLTLPSFEPEGYSSHFADAAKKGYSGTAIYVKEETAGPPLRVSPLGVAEFDNEGRTLILEYPRFTLINAYFPNSQSEGARLDYKLRFCRTLKAKLDELVAEGKNIILCGDYNIAHKPIDLANPKRNEKNPGYLPEEREWMDIFTDGGYVDTFRIFNQEPEQYTWWSYRFNARENNIGWRIDYFCVNGGYASEVEESAILKDIMGSDHCPLRLRVKGAVR